MFRYIYRVVLAFTLALAFSAFAFAGTKSGTNSTSISIPDYQGGPEYDPNTSVHSDIEIFGAPSGAKITKLKVDLFIEHTFIGDLLIWIENGSGTKHLLQRHQGGSQNDLMVTFDDIQTYNGESPNQRWSLWVQDLWGWDWGSIREWSIKIDYLDPKFGGGVNRAPEEPVPSFPPDGATLDPGKIELKWSLGDDPDGDTVTAVVIINGKRRDLGPDVKLEIIAEPGVTYTWQVFASDIRGNTIPEYAPAPKRTFTVRTENEEAERLIPLDGAPILIEPEVNIEEESGGVSSAGVSGEESDPDSEHDDADDL